MPGNRATEPISVAFLDPSLNPAGQRIRDLQIKDHSGKLVYHSKIAPTAGRTALYWAASLDGSLIVVLSAENEREYKFNFHPPPLHVGGGNPGPARGKRMHELFAFPEMTPLGGAIKLPRCEDRDPIAVWSADSQYVVYFDPYVFQAWFVGIQKPGDSHP